MWRAWRISWGRPVWTEVVERLAFYAPAPQRQIERGVFGALVSKESIEAKVERRVAAYGDKHRGWFDTVFLPTLECIDLGVLAWESVLEMVGRRREGEALRAFYGIWSLIGWGEGAVRGRRSGAVVGE